MTRIQNSFGMWDTLSEMSVNILDCHGSFIHQDSYRQRQATQRHSVDGLARTPERHHGRQQGERNGSHNNG